MNIKNALNDINSKEINIWLNNSSSSFWNITGMKIEEIDSGIINKIKHVINKRPANINTTFGFRLIFFISFFLSNV